LLGLLLTERQSNGSGIATGSQTNPEFSSEHNVNRFQCACRVAKHHSISCYSVELLSSHMRRFLQFYETSWSLKFPSSLECQPNIAWTRQQEVDTQAAANASCFCLCNGRHPSNMIRAVGMVLVCLLLHRQKQDAFAAACVSTSCCLVHAMLGTPSY